ncbi:flagellar biosynthesis protein FlhB [Pullulanibacillus pueri]|uniref:Uncharacterized protein n=1 Tax=Pullulanibacillus pueri TaxID=1437324 RepID=A0A8J2ZSW7_9BACL|nr:hypothetical protein [Pullulanibacillus pueri]MBM7681862.1 flagellar biosynthesis protein FlhB [Pullulanibacillus pueri]GGH76384.1 hypothetical protein GCM10007096_06730 [Pullulanibacillus pueri]
MGGLAQLAFSNFLIFALMAILIIYIIYLFIKRAVEKNDGDFILEAKAWNKETFWREFIFAFLNLVIPFCFVYLMAIGDRGNIIFLFGVLFILELIQPKRPQKSKVSKAKTVKSFRYIVYLVAFLLFVFLTALSTASVMSKIVAWLILSLIYPLEKIEKKYFISGSTSSHDV